MCLSNSAPDTLCTVCNDNTYPGDIQRCRWNSKVLATVPRLVKKKVHKKRVQIGINRKSSLKIISHFFYFQSIYFIFHSNETKANFYHTRETNKKLKFDLTAIENKFKKKNCFLVFFYLLLFMEIGEKSCNWFERCFRGFYYSFRSCWFLLNQHELLGSKAINWRIIGLVMETRGNSKI